MPYEIKKYQRTAERLAPPELAAVHPLGGAPVITDGEVTLAESGAIVGNILYNFHVCAIAHLTHRIYHSEVWRRKSRPS